LLLALTLLCGMLPSGALAAYDATKPACQTPGHEKFDGVDHNRPQSCWVKGHFACDGMNHDRAVCGNWGHFNCDGRTHGESGCGAAGHYACDGLAHGRAACGLDGHCLSDGKAHDEAVCGVEGHYACEGRAHLHQPVSKYCNAVPQHMICQGDQEHYCDPAQGGCGDAYRCSNSNAHTACRMCGLLWCDRTLGGHETPCGNANHRPCVYAMNGRKHVRADHQYCAWCGKAKCNGKDHDNYTCGEDCKACGRNMRHDENHIMECGHYGCVPSRARHERCPVKGCKLWMCDSHSHPELFEESPN